ncbi:MAG: hydrogenase expression/formation protein [Acetobacter sp.]|nr:hydrogenase expression/formation protein [Acetobacter sp.]
MSRDMITPPAGFGTGSTAPEGEGNLQYLVMPSGIRIYEQCVPEWSRLFERAEETDLALAYLLALSEGASSWKRGQSLLFKREGLNTAQNVFINDALGEGEVAIVLEDATKRIEIQETIFAGVWSLRGFSRVENKGDKKETFLHQQEEISSFPRVVLTRVFAGMSAQMPDISPNISPSSGVVNAPSIIVEILEHSRSWKAGALPHIINLTLLPHTPEDLEMIERVLGRGRVKILSRGYGNCRIESTAVPHVWRVRYFNSVETLILDTIEISEVPEVACAAVEDIADSAERLAEIYDVLRREVEETK